MKIFGFSVLAAFSLVAAAAAHAKIERIVEKTFAVGGAGTIRLETGGGSLTVVPGQENSVKVVARQRIRASSESEADDLLEDLDLRFEHAGNDVTATAKYRGSRLGFRFGSWPPVQVDFVATVPASFAGHLRTSGGSIEVGDLDGRLDVHTSGGSIKLGRIGGQIEAHTSGGSINLKEGRADVKLETSGGSITVGRVSAPADLSTSGGGIQIEEVAERVRAETSGGSIRAGIVGPLKEDCVLETSGGTVRVSVDKTAAFRLDASTSGGRVEADGLTITLTGDNKRNKVVGDVNGGGPVLKLRSSGGNISVTTR